MRKISQPGILFILLFIAFACHTQRQIVEKTPSVVNPVATNKEFYRIYDSLKIDTIRDKVVIEDLLDNETRKVYKTFGYRLIWIDKGQINKQGCQFLNVLAHAGEEGLNSADYRYSDIRLDDSLINTLAARSIVLPALLIRTDLLLTQNFLNYARDLYSGRVSPALLASEWDISTRQKDYTALLVDAIRTDQVRKELEALRPKNSQYYSLSKEMQKLETIAAKGGWPQVPYFEKIRPGDSSAVVPYIRSYLAALGYQQFFNSDDVSTFYNQDLERAVKEFQRRNGFTVDGVLGKDTRTSMLTSIGERISQIQINMDRMRWLPDTLGSKYITVNIPEFRLRYFEGNKKVNDMRVIVGKIESSTPLLVDSIKYIVFSPEWNVPQSIATKEMLPKLKTDPGYFMKNHFKIYRGRNEVQADSIDWSEYDEDYFPYTIVQQPCKTNALGRVKFIFPNSQNIYLHGTPSGYLFGRDARDMSHGCIRIEKPGELAAWLLKNNNQVNQDSINSYMNRDVPKFVYLGERVPVFFLYQTTWIDENGFLNYRKDIYGYDRIQLDLMNGITQRRTTTMPVENHNGETKNRNE
jgi:L,D-transpeptidase YcbB